MPIKNKGDIEHKDGFRKYDLFKPEAILKMWKRHTSIRIMSILKETAEDGN